jgi:hypothetical protein
LQWKTINVRHFFAPLLALAALASEILRQLRQLARRSKRGPNREGVWSRSDGSQILFELIAQTTDFSELAVG